MVAFEIIANTFVEKLAAGYQLQQTVKKPVVQSESSDGLIDGAIWGIGEM